MSAEDPSQELNEIVALVSSGRLPKEAATGLQTVLIRLKAFWMLSL